MRNHDSINGRQFRKLARWLRVSLGSSKLNRRASVWKDGVKQNIEASQLQQDTSARTQKTTEYLENKQANRCNLLAHPGGCDIVVQLFVAALFDQIPVDVYFLRQVRRPDFLFGASKVHSPEQLWQRSVWKLSVRWPWVLEFVAIVMVFIVAALCMHGRSAKSGGCCQHGNGGCGSKYSLEHFFLSWKCSEKKPLYLYQMNPGYTKKKSSVRSFGPESCP